ncbi:MAG TPA: hypothetical protein VJ861_03740 [Treponemataceae bacterium]|nr:hypothetical protein [Treponemataceae bacterium]
MIDIPETRIAAEIIDLLNDDLPAILLQIEEEAAESIRLLPFRYIGPPEELQRGTALPYALVEVLEGEYSEKDRIVKNRVYKVNVDVHCEKKKDLRMYYAGIEMVLGGKRFTVVRKSVDKGVEIKVRE